MVNMKAPLIGGSIRQQYDPKAAELLTDKFDVWQPNDNSRFAKMNPLLLRRDNGLLYA